MDSELKKPLYSPKVLPQIFKAPSVSKGVDGAKKLLTVSVEHNKQVMSLMDTLLTLFLVSPLIIGQWRGTWTLMEIYENVFPPWESFLFGSVLYLAFTIMRDGLQDLIQFETDSVAKTVLAYSLRRAYTYFFSVACILIWKSGWVIYDQWFDLEYLPDGRTLYAGEVHLAIGLFGILLLVLAALKSLRNTLAAPFVIGLDTKSTSFNFPTRYRVTEELYKINTPYMRTGNMLSTNR